MKRSSVIARNEAISYPSHGCLWIFRHEIASFLAMTKRWGIRRDFSQWRKSLRFVVYSLPLAINEFAYRMKPFFFCIGEAISERTFVIARRRHDDEARPTGHPGGQTYSKALLRIVIRYRIASFLAMTKYVRSSSFYSFPVVVNEVAYRMKPFFFCIGETIPARPSVIARRHDEAILHSSHLCL